MGNESVFCNHNITKTSAKAIRNLRGWRTVARFPPHRRVGVGVVTVVFAVGVEVNLIVIGFKLVVVAIYVQLAPFPTNDILHVHL